MNSTPQPIKSLLHGLDDPFGSIVKQARQLDTVRSTVLEALPDHAAAHIHVAAVDNARLVLHTDNAGWATRLRYAEPSIRRALAQRLRLHTDRVVTRVRPGLAPAATPRRQRRISTANREHMRRVSGHIDNPELAHTLQRLADRTSSDETNQAAATGRALT